MQNHREFSTPNIPEGSGNEPHEPKDREPKEISQKDARARLERIISTEHLRALARARSDFRYELDPTLPPHQVGYTRLDGTIKRIFLNPRFLEKFSDEALGGFLLHESGHHAPEVVELQNRFGRDLDDSSIIPEMYRNDQEGTEAFLAGLSRHLHNALSDVWLESFLSRRPFFDVSERILKMNHENIGEARDLRPLPKPEQLVQLIVGEHRFGAKKPLEEIADPDVLAAYHALAKNGALDEVQDRRIFESYFSTEADMQESIDRKYAAYRQGILPEYLKLVAAEVEKRLNQQQGGKGKKNVKFSLDQGIASTPSGAPLTKEEREKLERQAKEELKDLLKELEKLGDQFSPKAPNREEAHERTRRIREAGENAERRAKGQPTKETPKPGEPAPASERLHDFVEKNADASEQSRLRGLSEAWKVPEAAVRTWDELKKEYAQEIDSLAAALSEIFRDNRRTRIEFLRRQGEIVPGLEYETISAMLKGEQDPQTKMRSVRDPEFLETEVEFIVDTSGSMGGENIRTSTAFFVITTEAFRKIREDLAAENLLRTDFEQPLRIGVTTFDVGPRRIHELEKSITEQREAEIIADLLATGGGTSEKETIREVAQELSLHRKNIFKLIVVLSDGYGDQAAVHEVLEQLDKDESVALFAGGLGPSAEGVVETYLKYAEGREKETNVAGTVAPVARDALPPFTEFLKGQIERHHSNYWIR